jgi:hypothetical protein
MNKLSTFPILSGRRTVLIALRALSNRFTIYPYEISPKPTRNNLPFAWSLERVHLDTSPEKGVNKVLGSSQKQA